jgi:hypothetical protein
MADGAAKPRSLRFTDVQEMLPNVPMPRIPNMQSIQDKMPAVPNLKFTNVQDKIGSVQDKFSLPAVPGWKKAAKETTMPTVKRMSDESDSANEAPKPLMRRASNKSMGHKKVFVVIGVKPKTQGRTEQFLAVVMSKKEKVGDFPIFN